MVQSSVGKVLRVGVIYNGRILDEQIFRKPETIFIGDTAKSHFVVPSSSLPSKFPIFYFKSGRYELVIMENMSGKVFLKGKVVDIEEVIKKGMLKKRGNAYILPLSQDARGKVVVGSAIVLFQFIAPPPRPPKLKLPRSIRGSWTQHIDWPFISVQMACFVIGFIAINLMLKLPKPEMTDLKKVSNRFAKLIVPKIEEIKAEAEKPKDDGAGQAKKVVSKKETAKETKEEKPQKKSKKPRDSATRAKEEAMRMAEMKKKVQGVGLLKMIGSAGGDSGAGIISDVLGEGGKDKDIDTALAGVKQIGYATDSSQRSRKGEAGATETAKIDKLKVKKTKGKAKIGGIKEKAIVAKTKIGTPDLDGSVDSGSITKVVKRHARAIRRCYEKALKANPKLKGKIAVSFMINERGRVQMVDISQDTMGNDSVAKCIKSVVRRWRFPRPEGGPANVTFPFVFSPSN